MEGQKAQQILLKRSSFVFPRINKSLTGLERHEEQFALFLRPYTAFLLHSFHLFHYNALWSDVNS